MYHPVLQKSKEIPEGFSVTALFFGAFVPLCRGDFIWFLISMAVGILGSFIFFIPTVIMWLYLAFKYNEMYLLSLVKDGWVRKESSAALAV